MKMKNKHTSSGFVGKYESVFDHGITPMELREITGFSDRVSYLENIITSEFSGCADIRDLYSLRDNIELAVYYGALSLKAPRFIDRVI